MESDEKNSFKKLRDIVDNINSVDEAKDKLFDVITLMSEINNLYLEISYSRYEAMNELDKTAKSARQQQIKAEESLHACQLIADQNLANHPTDVDTSDIWLPEMEEFQEDTQISQEEIENLQTFNTKVLLKKRLEHAISKIPKIKEEYNDAHTERCELSKKLDDERKYYSSIISKIQKQYDEFKGFTKMDDS